MATSPLFMEMAPGFGFILGTMVFVPLFYSMQVLYLVKTTPQLPPATWALVIALQGKQTKSCLQVLLRKDQQLIFSSCFNK